MKNKKVLFIKLVGILTWVNACYCLANELPQLSPAQRLQLERYAKATCRYFISREANNLTAGLPHSAFAEGKYLLKPYYSEADNIPRWRGSHTNLNEITLRFLVLAAAFKMVWLTDFEMTWDQILLGLRTLRALQLSDQPTAFKVISTTPRRGHFHRTYWTTFNVQDRQPGEISWDNQDIQSSDDNALAFMNLGILEGLAADRETLLPPAARQEVINLCRAIRDGIDFRRFIKADKTICHEIVNGQQSALSWDRLAGEGPIILAAFLLSGQITRQEFYDLAKSFQNKGPIVWPGFRGAINIPVPSYHGAMFIHGLRQFHGLPTASQEAVGVNFFARSLRPVVQAHLDYSQYFGFQALGSQVMSQAFRGRGLVLQIISNFQAKFPGNEEKEVPQDGTTLALATAPHAWFIPLARWENLDQSTIDTILAQAAAYEREFFHDGLNQLGWEAVIPWKLDYQRQLPDGSIYPFTASNGQKLYSDMGRSYEALNSAYIVLSICDALNSKNISSYHVNNNLLQYIARYYDTGVSLPTSNSELLLLY